MATMAMVLAPRSSGRVSGTWSRGASARRSGARSTVADRQRHHRRGHHGQRQHAREQEVDRAVRAGGLGGQHVDLREEAEQTARGSRTSAAPTRRAPQGEEQFDAGLGQRRPIRRRLAVDGAGVPGYDRRRALHPDGRHLAGDGGELQEDVLQPLPTRSQVGEGQVAIGQPVGSAGHVGRRRGHADPVTRRGRARRPPAINVLPRSAMSSPGGAPKRISSPPPTAISSAGVPLVITWPRSMMTTRSATFSASSRSWVVSSTQVPAWPELAHDLADQLPAGHVDAPRSARRGNATSGRPTSARAQREALLLAARPLAPRGQPQVAEADPLQELLGVGRVGVERGVFGAGLRAAGCGVDAAGLEHHADARG